MMHKLKKSDLTVKSPGLQIRERIQKDFGDLKTFSQKIEMSESSVDQYLTHKNMGSTTFKIRLIRELGQDFNSLYLSDLEQVEALIDRMYTTMSYYDQLQDIELVEQLIRLGKTHDVSRRQMARLYQILARYKNAEGHTEQALAYLHRAASLIRLKGAQHYFSDLAAVLADIISVEKQTATLEKMYKDQNDFSLLLKLVTDSDLKSNLCLKVGSAFWDRNEASTALFYFNLAQESAESSELLGLAHVKLALAVNLESDKSWHIEEAEKFLRSDKKYDLNLLLARAKLALQAGERTEATRYVAMTMDRCGRKITAFSPELSSLWLKLNFELPQSESDHVNGLVDHVRQDMEENDEIRESTREKAVVEYILRLLNELPSGYLSAREHLNNIEEHLSKRGYWTLAPNEWLPTLTKLHNLGEVQGVITSSYLQLLGRMTYLSGKKSVVKML